MGSKCGRRYNEDSEFCLDRDSTIPNHGVVQCQDQGALGVSYRAGYARGASDSYIHNGEKPAMSLIQVFYPIVGFNLLLTLQELDMGVLQHMATL